MLKSELIKELERLKGDPEIGIKAFGDFGKRPAPHGCELGETITTLNFTIDRINEFPSPEIIIVEKSPQPLASYAACGPSASSP